METSVPARRLRDPAPVRRVRPMRGGASGRERALYTTRAAGDDRAPHPAPVEDLYGEPVHQDAHGDAAVPELHGRAHATARGLRTRGAAGHRAGAGAAVAEQHDTLFAGRLPDPSYAFERVCRMDGSTPWRFLPPVPARGGGAADIGEVIMDHEGCAAYLRTFRLPEARIGRGRPLPALHDHDRRLEGAAKTLGTAREALVGRIRDRGAPGRC
ncbi:hypothetical protein HW130_15510 [Streptomyces sp. PKU-EA00015]|uniref:hypothetical protein n=1 Tax=Streptomyces sp. PKU-EA00015 TaxID=2748326 RepID=UPI0015A1EDEE|nr:hypothetical protein [Streptomyces sp. PKU-EA00015]NWF27653.1 hypothetical protein [Streptomyces sp. PKU-EA00015]